MIVSDVATDLPAAAIALARRFAAGATMWCVVAPMARPRSPSGRRVRPPRHRRQAGPAGRLRRRGRSRRHDASRRPPGRHRRRRRRGRRSQLNEVMRRTEPWGLTGVWIGAGRRPPAGARRTRRLDRRRSPPHAVHAGDVVMSITSCGSSPTSCSSIPACSAPTRNATEDVCITCSDEGRLAEVTVVHPGRSGRRRTGGAREDIDVSLIEPVGPGDLVLVHAGVALTHLPGGAPDGRVDGLPLPVHRGRRA